MDKAFLVCQLNVNINRDAYKGNLLMHKLNRLTSLAIFFTLCAAVISAQTVASTTASSAGSNTSKFFPLSQVKEGLHGKAFTVFSGSAAQEFGVEILGVLPGAIGPQVSNGRPCANGA